VYYIEIGLFFLDLRLLFGSGLGLGTDHSQESAAFGGGVGNLSLEGNFLQGFQVDFHEL
jgi:hypothetical protein